MHLQHRMQGPSSPWCVGSVFFPPNLLSSGVESLQFNQVGEPSYLLSTGLVLEQDGPSISPKEQIQNFAERDRTPFVPGDLLTYHVQREETISNSCGVRGNLLQILQCGDGRIIVLFLCGDTYRVASTMCFQGLCGKWFAIQSVVSSQYAGQSRPVVLPDSVVLQHSVYQLSAVWAHSSEEDFERTAIVAARCKYYVYFITVVRRENDVQLCTKAVSKFQVAVTHVSWNPYVCEEAAVVLESGDVHLMDIRNVGKVNPGTVVDLLAKVVVRSPAQRKLDLLNQTISSSRISGTGNGVNNLNPNAAHQSRPESCPRPDTSSAPNVAQQNLPSVPRFDWSVYTEPQAYSLSEVLMSREFESSSGDLSVKRQEQRYLWWHCEYGWLIQTLLVANSDNVYLVDLSDLMRSASESSGEINTVGLELPGRVHVVASVCAPEFPTYCFHKSRKENILAFGKCVGACTYEFCVATEYHVILFDVRQPRTPLLQWEHQMDQHPPNLLIMRQITAPRAFDTGDEPKDFQGGRVILAASFKSGDIRVFCYGRNGFEDDKTLGSNFKCHKIDVHNWMNSFCAWGTSSRLYAPHTDVQHWPDIVDSNGGLRCESYPDAKDLASMCRKHCQSIAGLVLLPRSSASLAECEDARKFTLLQLTGWGELLIQIYEGSSELRGPLRTLVFTKDVPHETVPQIDFQDHRVCYEAMPTFLKHMQTGSILTHVSRVTLKSQQTAPSDSAQRGTETSVGSQISTERRLVADMICNRRSLMKHLIFPSSMYEVAQKGLSLGLPKALAPFVSVIPSDLNMEGNGYPQMSRLMRATAFCADSTDEDDEESVTFEMILGFKEGFEEDDLRRIIPLPLLLEMHHIKRSDRSRTHDPGLPPQNAGEGEILVKSDQQDYFQQTISTFVDGQEILMEGSLSMETSFEKLLANFKPLVISLGDASLTLLGYTNDPIDSPLLLYTSQYQEEPSKSDVDSLLSRTLTGDSSTGRGHGNSSQIKCANDVKWSSNSSHMQTHHKFATRGRCSTSSNEPGEAHLRIDPSICPIDLSFIHSGAELGRLELEALEDLQADFLLWQQGFSPYMCSF